MKKFQIYLLMLFFNGTILSCCKSKGDSTFFEFNNNTSHSLTIIPYAKGEVIISLDIKPNSLFEASATCSKEICFFSGGKNDSILVLFDGKYKSTHYLFEELPNKKEIVFSNNRNLFNVKNYKVDKEPNSRCSFKILHNYIFTEQDYLDAKAKN
jgi:hypothetical protein